VREQLPHDSTDRSRPATKWNDSLVSVASGAAGIIIPSA
jgi:hypothetical protein